MRTAPRLVSLAFAALGAVAAACGPSGRATADAGADAAVDTLDHCLLQTASVDDFVRNGWCAAAYAGAFGVHACSACGGYLVAGQPGPYTLLDCFYDGPSGALVGGWLWRDDGPCVLAGAGHELCRTVAYPPACGDGGAP